MRLTVTIPLLVLAVGASVVVMSAASFLRPRASDAAEAPRTGVEMLRSFPCRKAETKHIRIRGAEDGFSPAGDEPGYIRPGRLTANTRSFYRDNRYDQYQADRPFTDSIEVPARISSGLFVISLRKVANNDNDTFGIGDLSPPAEGTRSPSLGALVTRLDKAPGWRRTGTLYAADLGAAVLSLPSNAATTAASPERGAGAPATLLSYIRSGRSTSWLDVAVEDDTSVDFMGVAVCEEPERTRGLTLAPGEIGPHPSPDAVFLACRRVRDGSHVCDPYAGDTPCSTRLPLACFKPGDIPAPRALKQSAAYRSWSGGTLALSEPVRGDSFAVVAEADRYCAARFGAGWRAAEFHDGVREGIAARGDPSAVARRAWIDIADQPYATCWRRP